MAKNDNRFPPELLERVRRVGELFREIDDAAQRNDGPVVAQALLVWEQLDEADAATEKALDADAKIPVGRLLGSRFGIAMQELVERGRQVRDLFLPGLAKESVEGIEGIATAFSEKGEHIPDTEFEIDEHGSVSPIWLAVSGLAPDCTYGAYVLIPSDPEGSVHCLVPDILGGPKAEHFDLRGRIKGTALRARVHLPPRAGEYTPLAVFGGPELGPLLAALCANDRPAPEKVDDFLTSLVSIAESGAPIAWGLSDAIVLTAD